MPVCPYQNNKHLNKPGYNGCYCRSDNPEFREKELSEYQYDPKKYEERVRGRMSWGELEGELDDEQ